MGVAFDFQVRELIFKTIDLNSYRRTASDFSRFETNYEERRVAKHIETSCSIHADVHEQRQIAIGNFRVFGTKLGALEARAPKTAAASGCEIVVQSDPCSM